MNGIKLKSTVTLLILSLAMSPSLCYMTSMAGPISTREPVGSPMAEAFTEEELDELLAPIALYPDPLLAQVLPAATFIEQIDEAQRTLNGKSDDNLIADQNWDISVKSVAHYPQVLQMMNQKRDWTTALGQAYVNQSTDVEKAIQRLRAEAKNAGNLVSSDKMLVDTKTEAGQQVIVVEPAQPQVVYVPQYDPEVVYVQQSGPSTGAVVAASMISFGAGMAMGAWLNRGWNWYGGGIYYHGWRGGGWIGRSSSYVNVNVHRNVYINNSYRNVNVNRNINNRNINTYRGDLRRDAGNRRARANNRDLKRDNDRGDRGGFKDTRNDALRSKDNKKLDNYRGRDDQDRNLKSANTRDAARSATSGKDIKKPAKASSNSAFNANKSGKEVKQQHDRGSQSHQVAHSGGGGRPGGGGGGKAGGGGGGGGGGAKRRGGGRKH
ncbi:MAG: DUF3300 domain-containing protein [Acidobacteria bacterium]|nr:DUF3300 domain-containing protein [Acidobacteriota bacterium]